MARIRFLNEDGSLPTEARAHVDAQVDMRVQEQVPGVVDDYVAEAAAPHIAAATTQADRSTTEANRAQGIADTVQEISGLTGEDEAVALLLDTPGSEVRKRVVVKGELVVNVLDLGAKGDGITDDTAAIQQALTSSRNVFIPAGTYRTTATLTIPARTTLTMTPGSKLVYTGTGVAILLPHRADFQRLDGVTVEAATSSATSVGIHLNATKYATLHNVHVSQFHTGVTVDGSSNWAASNTIINPTIIGSMVGLKITADAGKQANHTTVLGGYIWGADPVATGSVGVLFERGDTNTAIATAVEMCDIGYSFQSVDVAGNGAVFPRVEQCNTPYVVNANASNTVLVKPVGTLGSLPASAAVFSASPVFNAKGTWYSNGNTESDGVRFKDNTGTVRRTIYVDPSNNVGIRTPNFQSVAALRFEVSDNVGAWNTELTVSKEMVEVRRALRLGTMPSLPPADATQRGKLIRVSAASGSADSVLICLKAADGSFSWVPLATG